MKLVVLAVGKLKERYFQEACAEYYKRIRRHLPLEVIELRTAASVLERCPPRFERWVLDVGGAQASSVELAAELGKRMAAGAAGIVFVIGGPEGLPAPLAEQASYRLSLSRLTLPHR